MRPRLLDGKEVWPLECASPPVKAIVLVPSAVFAVVLYIGEEGKRLTQPVSRLRCIEFAFRRRRSPRIVLTLWLFMCKDVLKCTRVCLAYSGTLDGIVIRGKRFLLETADPIHVSHLERAAQQLP